MHNAVALLVTTLAITSGQDHRNVKVLISHSFINSTNAMYIGENIKMNKMRGLQSGQEENHV